LKSRIDVSGEFSRIKGNYKATLQKISKLEESKLRNGYATGFFKKISNTFSNAGTTLDIKKEEKQLEPLLQRMAGILLQTDCPYFLKERTEKGLVEKDIVLLEKQYANLFLEKQVLESELSQCRNQQQDLRERMKSIENENYGFQDLVI